MRGKARPSAKRGAPVTLATGATLRSAFPITLCLAIHHFPGARVSFSTHPSRAQLYRFVDLDVARAAAEVAGERVLDLVARRLGVRGEQRFGRQQEGGRAVAAL